MNGIFKEPLLYFIIAGGALFALFEFIAEQSDSGSGAIKEIVISEGRMQAMALGFNKVWQRSPSTVELNGLVESFIREEILYREALAMGLDRDDPIVRRRMSQKIEFISEDLVALREPQRSELQAFMNSDPKAYKQATRFSFKQIYLNPNTSGSNIGARASNLLKQLRTRDIDPSETGDPLMLNHEYINATEKDISRALGAQFLQELGKTKMGSWQGPVSSGFGLHLVNISDRQVGVVPDLDEVRELVVRDWTANQRKQANETYYAALRRGYTVTRAKSASQITPSVAEVKENK